MWRASGRKYQMKRDRRKETENKMKKVYEKPQVYMERFELSQNIALCDYRLGSESPQSCNITADRFEDDGEDFRGGFVSKDHCSIITSVYCYTDGTGRLPTIFVS